MKNTSTALGVAIILLLSVVSARAQYTTAYITLFDGLTGYHSAEDLVLLPSGTVAVSGVFTPGSTTEFFTAAFTADGTPQWTNGLPDSIGQAWKIFQLNDGTLLSLGDFENHTGTNDVLAQRYSPTGVLLGQVVIDSPGLNNGDDLGDATMDAEGNVYLTGTFSTAGQAKPGLARLTPTGTLDWWVTYPVPAAWNGFGLGLAVEAIGDSLVVLWTRNGSSYSAALGFAPSGAHLWTTDLQVTTNDNNNAMTTDGLGHVLVAAHATSNSTSQSSMRTAQWPGAPTTPFRGLVVRADRCGMCVVMRRAMSTPWAKGPSKHRSRAPTSCSPN